MARLRQRRAPRRSPRVVDESGFLLIPNVARRGRPSGTLRVFSTATGETESPSFRSSPWHRRHLRGEVVLLGDAKKIHRCRDSAFLRRHSRVHVHRFPSYAPELNPDEFVWTQAKSELIESRSRRRTRSAHAARRAIPPAHRPVAILSSLMPPCVRSSMAVTRRVGSEVTGPIRRVAGGAELRRGALLYCMVGAQDSAQQPPNAQPAFRDAGRGDRDIQVIVIG